MDKPKVLSGHAIVAKGVTKIDACLPEVGLKDVAPNGSWLEQKQIQAALEARKHLIEVERIEKFGTLSHATWWDDLKLAEVTQKAGGHWQYLGHNVGKTLYLRPEEALFLMEVNCLLLKHGGVTVSLQKAYSLLLNDPASLMQYRVYASLSRLGYKVFRHKIPKVTKENSTPCPKTDLLNKSGNVEHHLTIDTEIVENVADQPLTDSSIEIIESKSTENVNIDIANIPLPNTDQGSNVNIDIVNIPLPNTECKLEKNECSEKESNETNSHGSSLKLENETTQAMEVGEQRLDTRDENKEQINIIIDNTGTANNLNVECNIDTAINETETVKREDNGTQNAETKSSEEVSGVNKTEVQESETEKVENKKNGMASVESENNVSQNAEPINTEAEHITTDSIKSEVLMDVDNFAEIKRNEDIQAVNTLATNEANSSVDSQMEIIEDTTSTEINTSRPVNNNNIESSVVENQNVNKLECMESADCQEVPDSTVHSVREDEENRSVHTAIAIEVDSADSDVVMDLDTPKSQDDTSDKRNTNSRTDFNLSDVLISKRNQIFHNYVTKLKRLTSRQCKPSNFKSLEKNFENVPDLFKKEVVTINVPDPHSLPKNIFVNNSSYVLDLNQIKSRSIRSMSVESNTYNSSDEVNGSHVRRIRNTSSTEYAQNLQFVNRFPPRQTLIFRPFNFWRPQNNYVQFNMFFQRPCFPNMYYSRFQYQRPNPFLRSFSLPNHMNFNPNNPTMNSNSRKRMRSAKMTHLQSIKNLAVRLKQLIMSGNNHLQNVESLHRLLYAYNARYKARLRLTKEFEVINDENIVETIDLEDDEESARKRRRLSKDYDMFEENLNLLRQLAFKLKDLEAKEKSSPKHRRAMSKAIKTFNKSYDADIYLNSDFDIINRRLIHIDSGSESDCVVNEPKKVHKKKKLRNPFNILKRLSEKQAGEEASTSKETENNNIEVIDETQYSQHITNTFNEHWLPKENDFGRAEVVHKNVLNSRYSDVMKEEYIINFIKDHFEEFNNWLEAKIAFLQHMEETDIAYQNEQEQMLAARESVNHSGLKPLIDTENCSDLPSVLDRLRIIRNNKEITDESNLNIHFDVYNRDVQNFRKTCPPKPHFRVICMEESSSFPSAAEVVALHSKYKDNVNIVFAIVGISSVSYLQINPIDLPIYVAIDDVD